jgi:tRNA-modifying protein YgfZ
VLAVIQVSSVEAAAVHWKSLAGPSLKITPLPYSLS